MMLRTAAAFLLMLSSAGGMARTQSYQPTFRPDALKDRPVGRPNMVLVLGSPHLSSLPNTFKPEMAEPIVERLARWQPTAVTSEDISGLNCDFMRHQGARLAESVTTYCYDPRPAGNAAKLDVPAANVEVEQLLASWPDKPSPAERRHLALLFLAAGEPASATVQWLRLPVSERRAGDGLTQELVGFLQVQITKKDETELVAARLAVRAGLERVWSIDDQSFDGGTLDDSAYGKALENAWNNPATKARTATDAALYARLAEPNGLLNIYRDFNNPTFAAQKYQSDWGAALIEPSANAYGRRYVAYWETRNLRMVANIREVLGRAPGTRLVAIVGASHKAYFEAYLHQMRDVTLDDVNSVL